MSNATLLQSLREQRLILDSVLPFGIMDAQSCADLLAVRQSVVMLMPHGTRPGPYWFVSLEDAKRLKAQGYMPWEAPDAA